MRYTVSIARPAEKFLRDLTDKRLSERLRHAIDALADDPRPSGASKMQGVSSYRFRVGDYRVVYEIRDDKLIVLVVKIDHRSKVYR